MCMFMSLCDNDHVNVHVSMYALSTSVRLCTCAFMPFNVCACEFIYVFVVEFVCMCGLARFVPERPLCIL